MLCKIRDYKTEKKYNVSFSCLALAAWFNWSSVQNALFFKSMKIHESCGPFSSRLTKTMGRYLLFCQETMTSRNHDVLQGVTYKCLVKACVVGMYVNIY